MATKDVARRNPSEAFATWVGAMQLEATSAQDETFDPSLILGNILGAESFDDALKAADSTLLSGKALVGRAHTILDFTLRQSDAKYAGNEKSLGVYAVVQAEDLETRELFSYGVGASNVLAILWQARQFGRIPGDFVITSRDTQNGELLSLRPVGTRTVRTESA
jgi:hypothetical protein